MNLQSKVTEIMTANVHTISKDDELHAAMKIIKKHKVRHLPVTDGKKPVGIISATDINRLTFGGLFDDPDGGNADALSMLNIEQVMNGNLRTIDANATVEETAQIFVSEKFHALPVTENGELKGIVTTTDVIRFMLEARS